MISLRKLYFFHANQIKGREEEEKKSLCSVTLNNNFGECDWGSQKCLFVIDFEGCAEKEIYL